MIGLPRAVCMTFRQQLKHLASWFEAMYQESWLSGCSTLLDQDCRLPLDLMYGSSLLQLVGVCMQNLQNTFQDDCSAFSKVLIPAINKF